MSNAWIYFRDEEPLAEVVKSPGLGYDWALENGMKKGHNLFRGTAIGNAQKWADKLPVVPPVVIPDPIPQPPPPPVVKAWPHAPGLPVLLDSDRLKDFEVRWNERGLCTEAPDATAPHSPPGVIRFSYPIGFEDGDAPGTPMKFFPHRIKHIYCGRWVRVSPNWQGHNGSGVNKLDYLLTNDQAKPNSLFSVLYGNPSGPFELRMYPQFAQGDKSKVVPMPLRLDEWGKNAYMVNDWLLSNSRPAPVVPGEWFQLETEIDMTLTPSITRWWLNGTLAGYYLGLQYPVEGFSHYAMAPVWGGYNQPVQDRKKQDDFILFDHVIVQGR